MRDILTDRYRLAEAPELAVMHALEATLIATNAALAAAYPEIEEADCYAEAPPSWSVDAYVADAVLTQITSLQSAISRYVGLIQRRYALRDRNIDGDF
jgi:hypothetical protein